MYRPFARQLARFLGAVAHRTVVGATARSARAVTVGVVDDPTQPIRLVRVAGIVDAASVQRVLSAWEHLTAPQLVHVDVQDAAIADATTMARLEAALDQLEHRRIGVRIVGIDPHHPAIAG